MNKIKIILATLFSSFAFSDQEVDLDSPEGWGMAFMTTSAQNLGQMPPRSVDFGDISISAELSSIPRLTEEQQKIGFGGLKDEDLNKSPAFGRLRVNFGLPWNLNAEMSLTPPLEIDGAKPVGLWGAALSRPMINNEKFALGLRLFLLRGGAVASVTCDEDKIEYAPYTPQNISGCVSLSDDKLQMDHEGAELFLSFNSSSKIHPWISFATSNLDNFVEIDAPLEIGREMVTIYSSGTTQTFSFGFHYDISENWNIGVASSFTPLDAQRPTSTSGDDDFWNFRVGLTIRL